MTIKELYETCSTIGEHTKWSLFGKYFLTYAEISESLRNIDIFLFDFDYISDCIFVKLNFDNISSCVYELSYVKNVFKKYQINVNNHLMSDDEYEALKNNFCIVDEITQNTVYVSLIRLEV